MPEQSRPNDEAVMPYYTMSYDRVSNKCLIYIFGYIYQSSYGDKNYKGASDITSELKDVPYDALIEVHINSSGGSLFEGIAIYNVLKQYSNVHTICDGCAASAASLIFCAGSRRTMNPGTLIFIHNAQSFGYGDANAIQKEADDVRKVTESAKEIYKQVMFLTDEELAKAMDEETWYSAKESVDIGIATECYQPVDRKQTMEMSNNMLMRIVACQYPHEETELHEKKRLTGYFGFGKI